MNYKEFEKINHYLSFHPSKNGQKVVFCVNGEDPHGFAEEKRQIYQDKYGNMSFTDFKKEYDAHFPEFNRRKYRREILINEFKSHKTEDFAEIPLDKKLDYLDAFCIDFRSNKEWERDYKGAYDNLVACLWSIRLPQEFLSEERKKINHFMNVLQTKKMNSVWQTLDLFKPELQKKGCKHFLHAFSQAYNVERIPVNYYIPKDPEETRLGFATPGKWGINIREDRKWQSPHEIMGIFFHESTHLRQDKIYEKNPEKYRIFTPEYGVIRNFIKLYYGEEKSHQIYELEPRESHAYYLCRILEEMINDRFFGSRLDAVRVPSHTIRTLYLDYQR